MSTHNIGFYEDLTKIIFELSSNTHLISSAVMQLVYIFKSTMTAYRSYDQLTLYRRINVCFYAAGILA